MMLKAMVSMMPSKGAARSEWTSLGTHPALFCLTLLPSCSKQVVLPLAPATPFQTHARSIEMISVLVCTKNEEQDLPGCLLSVAWSDDVHVFDSFSTDQTCEIAKRSGAAVHQREFDGYASQKNAGLHSVTFRHPWTLLLDADERVPESLAKELCD